MATPYLERSFAAWDLNHVLLRAGVRLRRMGIEMGDGGAEGWGAARVEDRDERMRSERAYFMIKDVTSFVQIVIRLLYVVDAYAVEHP